MRRYLRRRMAAWVRRRQGSDTLPLTVQRRRLYILPTRAGLGLGTLVFFMLIAGLNYANSLALFLTFLLSGFCLVTMHQCHRNLLGMRLVAAVGQPTFAGTPGRLQLTLENEASLARYRVEAGAADDPVRLSDLPPAGKGRIDLPIEAARRGVLVIDRLRLATSHPFGLFRAWTWVHAPIELLVYPRPKGELPMPTTSGQKTGSRTHGGAGADEWLGLRPFRDGDSPRQVDWKAYAREAPLLVKEYSASASELRLFDFRSLPALGTEARLEQLARWILDAEARGERYGLDVPGVHIAPDRGPEHRHRCLAALATYDRDVAHPTASDPRATGSAAIWRASSQGTASDHDHGT